MQRTITDIVDNLENQDSPVFSVKEMQVAIAAKKARRQDKNQDFVCYVLDGTTKPSQIADFFSLQEKNKETSRFQLVYKIGQHWSAADVNIQNKEIQVLLLDAANSLPHILYAVRVIKKHCPSAKIYYCGLAIQSDLTNCATFSLDHAFLLSKINNLHTTLPALEYTFSQDNHRSFEDYARDYAKKNPNLVKGNLEKLFQDAKTVNYIHPISLKDNLVCLLRNIQTLLKLDGKFKDKLMAPANAKTTLKDYIDARTIINEQGDKVNVAIDVKRRHIKRKTLTFFREYEEVQHLSSKRQKQRTSAPETHELKPPQ